MAAHDAASLPLIPNANCPKDWRTNREVRFKWRQQRARQWISFAEIAEWLAELNGRDAYGMLQRDLLVGDFEVGGKSQVRFLHFTSLMARMTRERLNTLLDMVEMGGLPADTVRSEYLAGCWIPRRMFGRWLAKHELPSEPARFEPQEIPADPEGAAIAALARRLAVNPRLTREEARDWCREQGHEMSNHAFQNRIWPQARIRAGLSAKGAAGRPKSSQ